MSVQDYYRRFCYWREDMMSVGCPDNESSYIDDFIGNLQWQVQLRVSNRRSRMSKLVDAFYEARFEETTLRLERMVKDLKEANEMNDGFPTEAANALNEMDDSVGEVSIASNQQTESYAEKLKANIAEPFAHKLFDDMPRSLSIELKEEDGDSDGVEACDEQHPDDEIQSNESAIKSAEDGKYFTDKLLQISFVSCEETELNEGNDCVVLGKMDDQNNACVFAKMPEPIPTENLLNIEVAKANQYLLDERPMVSHVDSLEDLSDLSYKDDVLGASDTNSLSLPNLGFTLQIFDPGTLAHSKKEDYESPLNASDSQLYGILLTERLMSCENTVNSSINEVNKQNGENDDYRNDAQDMFDETNPAFRTNVIDVDRVLEGMPHPNSIGIQGAKDVLDKNVNVALDASGLVSDRFQSYPPSESIFQGDESQVVVLKDSACNVIEEMVKPNSTYLQLAWEYHEPVVTENVEQTMSDGVGKPSVMNMECLKVADNLFGEMPSPHSIGLHEKYRETSDSGSKSDCSTKVAAIDQFILTERTTLLLDKLLVRVPVENHDYVVSVPIFVGYCFMWHLSSNKLPLNTLSLNHLGSHENGERCVGGCKDDVVFTDDALFLFDPGGSSLFSRHGDPIELNQEQRECCYTIIIGDASARLDEYYNDALGVYGGFEIVVEYESLLIWNDHIDTWESILMVHDRCIPRKCGLNALDEKMQASATIIGYHKWNINGVLLVVIDASSVLCSCVAWHNTDVVTLITHSVFCDKVIQQLMLSMKACGITALLKDRNSLRKMVDRVVIIEASISLNYSYQLGEQVHFYIIMSNSEFSSFYVVISMLVGVVWDPGQYVISFYIIEDNDVLKRKGIEILLALAYSLVEWNFCTLLLITSSKLGIRNLYGLMKLLVSSVGCDLIDPNSVKQDAECWKTFEMVVFSISIWLYVMRNVLFAAARKTFEMVVFSTSRASYPLWQCLNRNGKCRDIIPHLSPIINCSIDEYLQHMRQNEERLAEAYLKDNDGASHEVMAGTQIYSKCTGQCKNVHSFNYNGVVFIFDPGGCGEIVWLWSKGVFSSFYCQSHDCLVMCMWSHITSLVDEMKRAYMGKQCHVSSVLPTWQDVTHPSCLVECSRDSVTVTTLLYLDEARFFVRAGNYNMPMSLVGWTKETFSGLK